MIKLEHVFRIDNNVLINLETANAIMLLLSPRAARNNPLQMSISTIAPVAVDDIVNGELDQQYTFDCLVSVDNGTKTIIFKFTDYTKVFVGIDMFVEGYFKQVFKFSDFHLRLATLNYRSPTVFIEANGEHYICDYDGGKLLFASENGVLKMFVARNDGMDCMLGCGITYSPSLRKYVTVRF